MSGQIKAFMSTGALHAEDGSRYVCGLNVESAILEAGRILGAVEYPEPYGRVNGSPTAYYASGQIPASEFQVRAALAEALERFISAPSPDEWEESFYPPTDPAVLLGYQLKMEDLGYAVEWVRREGGWIMRYAR